HAFELRLRIRLDDLAQTRVTALLYSERGERNQLAETQQPVLVIARQPRDRAHELQHVIRSVHCSFVLAGGGTRSSASIAKTKDSFCQVPDTNGEITSTVSLLTDGG